MDDAVFYLISQNNEISASEISQRLKISLSTTKRRIKDLKESRKLERIGTDKVGRWKIIAY